MSAVVRHGYFVARTGEGFGDVELAMLACEFWHALGFDTPGLVAAGLIARPDGVAIWEREDGTRTARLVAPDLFTGLRVIRELDPDSGEVL